MNNGYPSTEVPPLFAQAAEPVAYTKPRPAAPVSRAAGEAHIAPERSEIDGFVARLLYAAGPVIDGKGGRTLNELAVAVSAKRGKDTDRTSLTQTMKNLRSRDTAMDSGQRRVSVNDVKSTTIWTHTEHAARCVPPVPATSNATTSNQRSIT